MEISEIHKAKPVGRLQKKEGIQLTKVEDRLSISSESEKKGIWVEMLKQMPDVRPDRSLKSPPSSLELAQKILNSDT